MPASTPCPICEEPSMAEISPFCSAGCLHASPSTAKSKDMLRRLERFEGRSTGDGGPGGMVSVGPEVPRNLSLYLAGAQDEAAFLDAKKRTAPATSFHAVAAVELEIRFDVSVNADPEKSQIMLVRAILGGAMLASASASRDYLDRSSREFGLSHTQVCQELKDALLDEVKGIRKRVTVHGTKATEDSAVWLGRVLVCAQGRITGAFLTYDFSTGETGPEDVEEYVRNSFRRDIHEMILRSNSK